MIHAHMALWITGAPRIDKIEVPRAKSGESGDGKNWVDIDVVPPSAAEPQSTSSSSAGLSALAADMGLRQAMGTKEERSVCSPESFSYMLTRFGGDFAERSLQAKLC